MWLLSWRQLFKAKRKDPKSDDNERSASFLFLKLGSKDPDMLFMQLLTAQEGELRLSLPFSLLMHFVFFLFGELSLCSVSLVSLLKVQTSSEQRCSNGPAINILLFLRPSFC